MGSLGEAGVVVDLVAAVTEVAATAKELLRNETSMHFVRVVSE